MREVAQLGNAVDAPLMEAGLDSLGAVELRSRLADRLSDSSLPETLVFDFPTLRQIKNAWTLADVSALRCLS